MISLQTNVNSLVAQQNLNVNGQFQSKTIQQLTSGYRINSSGDDAAGLAVANKFRSTVAELTQGVANGNDGVAQLQIMDGGMNNIAQMLDRLKTLATQSASGAFTGDRTVLNNEYQTDVGEIDRQAQSIGLSTGGHFAQSLGVYIGGGTTTTGTESTANGTVSVDLSGSVVDSKALGLRTADFEADAATGTNLAAASTTSIASIASANSTSAVFELSGAGFSGITLSVAVAAADTTATLAAKLNDAIQAAGNAGTASGNAIKAANIQANAVTDSSGNQSLSFTSSTAAFQVVTGNNTANALMGSFDSSISNNPATGASVSQTVAGTAAAATNALGYVGLKVFVNGTEKDLNVKLAAGLNSVANYVTAITTAGSDPGYAALSALGVTATASSDGTKVQFVGNSNQSIYVESAGDTGNTLGLGSWQQGSQITGAAQTFAQTQAGGATLLISVNGGGNITLTTAAITAGNSANTAGVLALVTGAANYGQLQALGISAVQGPGNTMTLQGTAGQTIAINGVTDAANVLGFGTASLTPGIVPAYNTLTTAGAVAGTSGDTATMAFSVNGGDKILVSFTSAGGGLAADGVLLQAAINSNSQLKAAGITVGVSIANITSSNTAVNFRAAVVGTTGSTLNLGLGAAVNSSTATYYAADKAADLSAAGSSETGVGTNNDVFSFTGLKNVGATAAKGDQQILSFSATDASGKVQSYSYALNSTNGYDVDTAVKSINTAIQATNNGTLQKIVAVKETNAAGTAEGIRFISSLNTFSVGVGVSTNSTSTVPVGMYDGTPGAAVQQGMTSASSASGSMDISTQAGAEAAVIAVGAAITALGSAQAAVGKGENQLNYAISLAQSQITNFSTAESNIRDANVAQEAANLTKAQVLQQASIAAMAQANSAPQAVLTLLRG